MFGLCCNEKYGTITNHNNVYDDGDNDRNKDGNDDANSVSRSESDGLVFDLITTPCSYIGLADEYWATTATELRCRRHMNICVGIYITHKYPINTIVNVCQKLLYAEIGVLELYC